MTASTNHNADPFRCCCPGCEALRWPLINAMSVSAARAMAWRLMTDTQQPSVGTSTPGRVAGGESREREVAASTSKGFASRGDGKSGGDRDRT